MNQGLGAGLDELGVDAMHMVALVEPGPEWQMHWNRAALALAQVSKEPHARNWDASLANNIGMTLHEQGHYQASLESFRTALAARERIGKPGRIREAHWMIAWTLRFLKRQDEALLIVRRLQAETTEAPDGHVFEELGENLLILGRDAEARPYFARAWELLSKEPSPLRADQTRLEGLRRIGGG